MKTLSMHRHLSVIDGMQQPNSLQRVGRCPTVECWMMSCNEMTSSEDATNRSGSMVLLRDNKALLSRFW